MLCTFFCGGTDLKNPSWNCSLWPPSWVGCDQRFWLVDTLWSRRQFGVVICFKLPWWIGSLKNTIFASFFPDPNPFSPLVWWVFWLPHLRYLWCPSGGQEDQYFCHSCQALGAHFNFFQMTLLTLFATGNCNNLKPMGSPGFLLEGLKVVRLIRLRSLRLMVAREPGDWWKEFLQNFQDFFPEVLWKLTALSLEILNFEKGKFEELQSLLHESPFVEDIEIKIIQTEWGEKRREESSQLSSPVNLLEHGSISHVSITLMQFLGGQFKATINGFKFMFVILKGFPGSSEATPLFYQLGM